MTSLGEPCKRHDRSDGICTPFKSCPQIFNLNERAKTDGKLKALIRNNVCRATLTKVLVCCPNKGEFNFKILSANCATLFYLIENYCVNPNADEGTCTLLANCSRLYEMSNDKDPQTPGNLEFLMKSQCGDDDEKPSVCCTDEDKFDADTRRVLEKLKSPLIPRPPECGQVLTDLIIGGNVTGLTEFLWLVSLKYRNSEWPLSFF